MPSYPFLSSIWAQLPIQNLHMATLSDHSWAWAPISVHWSFSSGTPWLLVVFIFREITKHIMHIFIEIYVIISVATIHLISLVIENPSEWYDIVGSRGWLLGVGAGPGDAFPDLVRADDKLVDFWVSTYRCLLAPCKETPAMAAPTRMVPLPSFFPQRREKSGCVNLHNDGIFSTADKSIIDKSIIDEGR